MSSVDDKCLVQEIDGERYSIFFDPKKIREALQFKPRSGDIILFTYPASGTHWMTQMIQLIIHEGRSARNQEDFYSRSHFLEHFGKKVDEVRTYPRLLYTHIRPGKIPITLQAKYVYVARAPWDVCPSLYETGRGVPGRPTLASFEEYMSMFLEGNVGMGSHFQHIHAGYTRKHQTNFFFVTYEEMSRDLKGVLLRLADFLRPDYASVLRDDPELLRKVADQCSAEFMRRLPAISEERLVDLVFQNPDLKYEAPAAASDVEKSRMKFVREAKPGRWVRAFSKDQLRLLLEKINKSPEAKCVQDIWQDEFLKVRDAAQ